MLTALLCDMGNVLIRYEPGTFLDRYGIRDPQDRALLLREIFRSPLWPKMDLGELDEAGLEALVLPRLPGRLHAAAHNLIFRWDEPILPVPGMAGFLRACKEAGLRLYLLSNASRRQPAYWPRVPGSFLFDGSIVSAYCRCVKPSPEIYQIALEKFRLFPEECLFVDDLPENVRGAEDVGIPGFLFTGDVSALRRRVAALGRVLSR